MQKLTASLERAENRLIELAKLKDVDMGYASIYREVQGLQGHDRDTRAKRAMLKNVFEANVLLQKRDRRRAG